MATYSGPDDWTIFHLADRTDEYSLKGCTSFDRAAQSSVAPSPFAPRVLPRGSDDVRFVERVAKEKKKKSAKSAARN